MNAKNQTLGYKALSDPIRLRIIKLLSEAEELCVCKIVPALKVSQPRASQHLRILRESGIVKARRQGRWIHYRLERQRLAELAESIGRLTEKE